MKILTTAILIAISTEANATLPVIDYTSIAQDAYHEVVNFAKWAETTLQATETQLNTLNSYENSLVHLARMGDPNQLRNLPGIRTISQMYGTVQELQYDYQSWQRYLDPQRYQYDMNSILSSYKQPSWNGFTSMNGYQVLPNVGEYQFDNASWNISNDAQTQLQQLEKKRQILEKQRDAELAAIESASDETHIHKHNSVLAGINGALAELAAHEQSVLHNIQLKQQQISSGQRIYQTSQREQIQMNDYQQIDSGLTGLPTSGYDQPMLWGKP